jgi:iron complex outermembrane receptor protein
MSQGASPTGSVMYKPRSNQTAYVTFADSIQAPDTAPASSGTVVVANASQPLPPYRSVEFEAGYKVESRRMNFTADLFRIRRPFADVEQITPTAACAGQSVWVSSDVCEVDKIIGQQLDYGAEGMLSGNITHSLRLIGGITVLDPKLTQTFVLLPAGNPYVSTTCTDPKGVAASALICPSYVTNNKILVGDSDYKSNILAEYQAPALRTGFFTFDWHFVGRRPADDMNSYYVPQYNTFDLGGRYSARIFGRLTTWLLTFNNVSNVHYWSTLGPGSITGQSSADLAHLGEPRLITASMRYDF